MPDEFDDFTSITQEDLNPEIEEEEELPKREQDLPFAPPPKATGAKVKSALDAVLDAVNGKPPIIHDRKTCPFCGSKNTERRGALSGGTMTFKCRERGCRKEFPLASRGAISAPPPGSVGAPSPQGPFFGEPRPAPEPHTPLFKRKS